MSDDNVKDTAQAGTGLLRSSALVGCMTMLSRVLGLLRDIVIASFVGASANADAFFIAFKIPNFLRRLFAEGAFAQAFVPVLADYKAQGSISAVKALVDRVAGVLGGSLLLITTLAILAAPLVTAIFAPGFVSQPEKFELKNQVVQTRPPFRQNLSLYFPNILIILRLLTSRLHPQRLIKRSFHT